MTRDEVLLWLNDHHGRSVHVDVLVKRGDTDEPVLALDGELRFWGTS